MKIAIAYETSKGLFWSKEEAHKKENRRKDPEASYYNNSDVYEKVREVYILIADVDLEGGARGIGKVSKVFKLNQVEVQ
jgi:hypothetical protein